MGFLRAFFLLSLLCVAFSQSSEASVEPSAPSGPSGGSSGESAPSGQPSAFSEPSGEPSAPSEPFGETGAFSEPSGEPSAPDMSGPSSGESSAFSAPSGQPSAFSEPSGEPSAPDMSGPSSGEPSYGTLSAAPSDPSGEPSAPDMSGPSSGEPSAPDMSGPSSGEPSAPSYGTPSAPSDPSGEPSAPDMSGPSSGAPDMSGPSSGEPSAPTPVGKLPTSEVAPFEDVTLVPDDLIFSIYMDGSVPLECDGLKPEEDAPMVCCQKGQQVPFSALFPDSAKFSCPATKFNGMGIQAYLGCDGGEVTFAEGCYQPSWFMPENVDPATVSENAKSAQDCGCYSSSRGAGCRVVNSPSDIGHMLNIEALKSVKQKSFALFGKCHKAAPAAPEVAHTETYPIVVVTKRSVRAGKMDEYKAAHSDLSTYLKKRLPNMKAFFFAQEANSPSVVQDVQWFNDLDTFHAHMDQNDATLQKKIGALMALYDNSSPMTGDVYGGWDDDIKKMVEASGAKVRFNKHAAGYIKQHGDGLDGNPIIISSHRTVQAGKMDDLIKAGQSLANYLHENVPGVVAFGFAQDPQNPNLVHDLQAFANLEAFQAHVDMQNHPELMKRGMSFAMLYDQKTPFSGEVWTAGASDEEKVAQTTAMLGAAFTPYNYPAGSADFSSFSPSDNHADAFVKALQQYPKDDPKLVEWAKLMDDNVEFCRNGMCMQGVKMVTYQFGQFGSLINAFHNTIYDISEVVLGERFVWFKTTMESLKTNGGCTFQEDTPRLMYFNDAGKITHIQQYIVPDAGLNAFLTAAMMGTKCDSTPAPPAASNPMATEKGYVPTQADVDRFVAGKKDTASLTAPFVDSVRVCSEGKCSTGLFALLDVLVPKSLFTLSTSVSSWKSAEGILLLQTVETLTPISGCRAGLAMPVFRILYFNAAGKITTVHQVVDIADYVLAEFEAKAETPCPVQPTSTNTTQFATSSANATVSR